MSICCVSISRAQGQFKVTGFDINHTRPAGGRPAGDIYIYIYNLSAPATCRLSTFVVRKTQEAETGVRDILGDHFHLFYYLIIRLSLVFRGT